MATRATLKRAARSEPYRPPTGLVRGTTEVTNAQYTAFLSAVATTDTHSLYSTSMGSGTRGGITRSGSSGSYTYSVKIDAGSYTYANKPVVYVSFWDAARFSNWLHNGQGSGDTENGAYTLGGVTNPVNNTISRNPGATWFVPTENEWYKAAYHKNDGDTGNYWDYAASNDTVPDNNLPSSDSGNSANFRVGFSSYTTGDSGYRMTDAGAYGDSASPYGTFDQGGNVWEWNETLVSLSVRGLRGGSWGSTSYNVAASYRYSNDSSNESDVGFRVASNIPESSNGVASNLCQCVGVVEETKVKLTLYSLSLLPFAAVGGVRFFS